VVCEYGVYIDSCFNDHPGLTMPEGLQVIQAIGLFHVHGHKSDCLHRFAMTYIPGMGVIDGEILETLWAVLNKCARSTCGATIAHCTKVLDDHMGDSNWKKIINMGICFSLHLEFIFLMVVEKHLQLLRNTNAQPENKPRFPNILLL